jgi:RNA polymerase sigma-70 factor (ECF subfamily)
VSGFRDRLRYLDRGVSAARPEVEGRVEQELALPAGEIESGRAGLADVSDDALVARTRADPSAFAILYERHRLAVYRYLRARTSSDDAAADLSALTFERALAGLDRFRPAGGGFPAWLLRIARNAAIDAARRDRGARSLDDLPPLAHPAAGDDPEAAAVRADELDELRRQVHRLGDQAAEALALRYGAGLSAREIGVVIGKSEAATQKLLSRALEALREVYPGPA